MLHYASLSIAQVGRQALSAVKSTVENNPGKNVLQLIRSDGRSRTPLGCYPCCETVRSLAGLLQGTSSPVVMCQTCSEGISSAHSVLYFHAETRMLDRLCLRDQYTSAVASSNANQPQVEFRQQPFGEGLLPTIAQPQQGRDSYQFFFVELHNVGMLEGTAENFLIVERLAEIHIADAQTGYRADIQEVLDGRSRHRRTLRERTETNYVGSDRQLFTVR